MLRAFADGAFFGERFGTGPARILALHGWERTHEDFRRVLRDLDAIAVDLPGFGASPPPPEAWGAREYAKGISPVLDEFAEPPVVLGHSFGGRVAVCLAAEWPGKTRALVLTGTPLVRRSGETKRRPPPAYRAIRFLGKVGLVGAGRLERARRRYGSEDYRRASGVMRAVLVRVVAETYEEELRRLSCPVELVWGAADDDVPLEVARRAATLLNEARLTVLPATGHHTPLTAADALRAAALRALAPQPS